ncbi:MAG: UDP-2,3-diacylglucosamine diphosphatase [Gammaproteobacteria bacterium]|nr:MAG: UDP-2,3-diacylglucosamine diphosphatase [Gammaproteobacteria bacterium]
MRAAGHEDSLRYRTVFVSDIHLGSSACAADLLLDFLGTVDCETLYLVGDIIDVWSLKKQFYWPASHNEVVRRILKAARNGTRVIYIPGNHDELFRDHVGLNVGGVEIRRDSIHQTADGRRLLVLHGDEFDQVVQFSPWLASLGAHAYERLIRLNAWVNRCRRWFGAPHWSLAKYLKHRVKNAVQYMGEFERAVTTAARQRGVDGLVCGHIHHAEISTIDGITYCNDGDWVETCSALVEHSDGRLEILRWAEHLAAREARGNLTIAVATDRAA